MEYAKDNPTYPDSSIDMQEVTFKCSARYSKTRISSLFPAGSKSQQVYNLNSQRDSLLCQNHPRSFSKLSGINLFEYLGVDAI